MADKDLLGQSLSEEEELALPPPGKRSSSLSPSRTPKTRSAKGYKFTSESTSKPDNFDFATQSKNGSHQPSTGSSSEEGEEFEHLNPLEESGGDPKAPQVPPQINKLPTPHKRTAELAENGDDPKSFKGFGNGSPPSSPAAKRSKNFQDYLAEDEAKRQQKLQETREGPPKEIGGDLGNLLKFGGIMVSIFVAVGLAIYFSEVDVNLWGNGANQVGGETQKISKYGWKSASEKIHRSLKQLEKQFPHQNRETWIQLHSSILSTFSKTEPVHPSAITLLYPSSLVSSKFPLCFTSKIAQAINSAVAPILQNVNSSKLAKPHPPKIITPELFEQQTITQIRIGLDNYFSMKGKALVVDKVTEVKSEGDLLLFHGLCDNFKAVDKRATILFPVEVDKEVLGKFEWIHDRAGDISQDVLNTKFAKIVGADTGPSIVARIADAVVLINEGDKCDD